MENNRSKCSLQAFWIMLPRGRFLGGGSSSSSSRRPQAVRHVHSDRASTTTRRRRSVVHGWLHLIGVVIAICGCMIFLSSHVVIYSNQIKTLSSSTFLQGPSPRMEWHAHSKNVPSTLDNNNNNNNLLLPPLSPEAELLPDWMQEYIEWHTTQRAQLTVDNYQNYRFLVLRCLHVDTTCGGISDRLKPLPLLVQLAAASQRILLIAWQRPAPLEEFLLVPALSIIDGQQQQRQLDWRVPSWLNVNGIGSRLYTKTETLVHALHRHRRTVMMTVKLQDQHGGSQIYNALEEYRLNVATDGILSLPLPALNWTSTTATRPNENNATSRAFRGVFRALWSVLFVPSQSVAAAIRRKEEQLGLSPFLGENVQMVPSLQDRHQQQKRSQPSYVAAHVRAYYGNSPISPERRAAVAINALQCANGLRRRYSDNENDTAKQQPILLLSDSRDILQAGLKYQQRHPTLPIRISSTNSSTTTTLNISLSEPLHLDKASSRVAADYVSVFVDLYLLANAECVAHGQGGFGRFGSLLSRNASCVFKYFDRGQFVDCKS